MLRALLVYDGHVEQNSSRTLNLILDLKNRQKDTRRDLELVTRMYNMISKTVSSAHEPPTKPVQ
jgi:hypothetical protein